VHKVLNNLLFRDPSSKLYWLLIALLARTLYFILEIHFMGTVTIPKGVWGICYDETYFDGISNFIKTGSYNSDERMPGLGIIYLPLALLFPKVTALNIFIILQVILSAVSAYVLALTAKLLFKKDFFFYATFYIYLLSCFTAISNSYPGSESFATSMLIFAVFYYVLALENYKKFNFILSGIFLTWVIFMRPALFPLICVFALLILIHFIKSKQKPLPALLMFLLPLVIIEGSWITRNYFRYHKIIPTLNSIYLSNCKDSYRFQIWQFEKAWGKEDWGIDWLTEKDTSDIRKEQVPFPSYIYTSKYNADSLRALKVFLNKSIVRYQAQKDFGIVYIDTMSKENLQVVEAKCNAYIESLKNEKSFTYYVISRWVIIKHSFKLDMFGNFQEPFLGMVCAWVYYFIIFIGFIGIILLGVYCFRFSYQVLIPIIPLYSVFIHSIVLRLSQSRYFVPSYPFMLICAVYALYWICNKVKDRSTNKV
jgi:hypothetical protein